MSLTLKTLTDGGLLPSRPSMTRNRLGGSDFTKLDRKEGLDTCIMFTFVHCDSHRGQTLKTPPARFKRDMERKDLPPRTNPHNYAPDCEYKCISLSSPANTWVTLPVSFGEPLSFPSTAYSPSVSVYIPLCLFRVLSLHDWEWDEPTTPSWRSRQRLSR